LCRDAAEIFAHDLFADGRVASHHGDVERWRTSAARGEIGRDGPGGIAVSAEDDGGDALRDLRFGKRIGFEAVGGVVVNIDEAGGEDQPFGVDDFFIGLRFEVGGDGEDAVAGDSDAEFAEWGTSAVGDLGVEDEDGFWRGVLRLSARVGDAS
jgi:hypothetical protein